MYHTENAPSSSVSRSTTLVLLGVQNYDRFQCPRNKSNSWGKLKKKSDLKRDQQEVEIVYPQTIYIVVILSARQKGTAQVNKPGHTVLGSRHLNLAFKFLPGTTYRNSTFLKLFFPC